MLSVMSGYARRANPTYALIGAKLVWSVWG